MPINNGVIEMYAASSLGGGVTARIFYDNSLGINPDGSINYAAQTIINNASGAALEVINTTEQTVTVRVTGPTGTKLLGSDGTSDIKISPSGMTATAVQLRQQAGIRTRADVAEFGIASP